MRNTTKIRNVKPLLISLWTALAALAILMSACARPTPEPAVVEPVVATPEISQPIARWNSVTDAGTWVLIGYDEAANPTVVVPGTYVTIDFSASDDAVSGLGGCNSFNTTYTADDNSKLTIKGPIAATLMACENGMDQEVMFLGALETVTGYTLTEDGHLLLDYNTGVNYDQQLNFVRGTPLVDTQWVLTGYGDPNNLTPSQTGVMTTAVFSADGNLNGSGGCNQYSAGYTLQEGQIEVSLPTSTMMACEVGMEQEQAFLTTLGNSANYHLGLGTLDITTADGSSLLRFSALHLPLENVRWQLTSINGVAVPEGLAATVLFTPSGTPANKSDENSITGGGGCNNFIGSYTISGDMLTINSPLGVTQTACDGAVMQVEQGFLAGLESAQNYQITLNQLIINTSSGSLLLYADRMPLEGPQWVLSGIGPVNAPSPPAAGTAFTASFNRQSGLPSGVKSGATGCNDYTTTYYASLDEIKVDLPDISRNECSGIQSDAEQAYFLGLNTARMYRILNNELYIYYEDSVLVFTGSYPSAPVVETGGPLTPLNGTQWWLSSIGNTLTIPGSEVTAVFAINPDGQTGTISGSGGCNTYNAGITGVFTLASINATSSACDTPTGIMQQESVYLSALGTATEIVQEGGALKITTASGVLVFTNTGPVPVQPLPPTSTPEAVQPLPLIAVINAPTEGMVNQTITFDGTLSSSSVDITTYSWTFGDGTVAEGATIEHTFTTPGSYDVILTVTDANGQTADASVMITIQ